jgi:hypothetical protein
MPDTSPMVYHSFHHGYYHLPYTLNILLALPNFQGLDEAESMVDLKLKRLDLVLAGDKTFHGKEYSSRCAAAIVG